MTRSPTRAAPCSRSSTTWRRGPRWPFHTAGEIADRFRRNNVKSPAHQFQACCADILVDDIGYRGRTVFFRWHRLAQAVDEVVTSTTHGGSSGALLLGRRQRRRPQLRGGFQPRSLTPSGAPTPNRYTSSKCPTTLTGGRLPQFQGRRCRSRSQDCSRRSRFPATMPSSTSSGTTLFCPASITSDYNLLVFDANGKLPEPAVILTPRFTAVSTIISSTGEAGRICRLAAQSGRQRHDLLSRHQQNLRRARARPSTCATSSRTAAPSRASTCAPPSRRSTAIPPPLHADGIAAYDVHDLSTAEYYESFGPVTIYFDDNGNRLATPIVRQQPTLAAVDGVDTTFFPEGPVTGDDSEDSDNPTDGFPNFYGTSAAAPACRRALRPCCSRRRAASNP